MFCLQGAPSVLARTCSAIPAWFGSLLALYADWIPFFFTPGMTDSKDLLNAVALTFLLDINELVVNVFKTSEWMAYALPRAQNSLREILEKVKYEKQELYEAFATVGQKSMLETAGRAASRPKQHQHRSASTTLN